MFQPKTKQCQNCQQSFVIAPEDFEFYQKINVPAPTFCPECRMVRRMASWNERTLYRRKCDLCQESIISLYAPDKPFKVYCNKCWWSDKWDPMEYGRDYDFNRSFFEQFHQLQKEVPIINLLNKDSVNSEYCHDAAWMKNCYLTFVAGPAENCSYGTFVYKSKDCLDVYDAFGDELCYSIVDCSECYQVFFSEECKGCRDSAFLFNCRDCSDCFGCVNLCHKKYYIFNKSYSKEEYQQEIMKYDLGSYGVIAEISKKFDEFNLKFPRKFARISKAINVSGNDIRNAKNCQYCFKAVEGAEDCKYSLIVGLNTKDSYDLYDCGFEMDLSYESVCCVENVHKILFSIGTWIGRDIQYSDYCQSCNDCFGCISLKKKQYCILNKQYSKEEYREMVEKIKKQMNGAPYKDKKGNVYGYGEYFPAELSRFGYNESCRQQYKPLTKEQALKEEFNWHDKSESEYRTTVKAEDLADHIRDTDESILKEVIQCQAGSKCFGSGVFKVIQAEYEFYKEHNLALPRLCPECRHRKRMDKRNLLELYQRQCMCRGEKSEKGIYQNQSSHFHQSKSCANEFKTTYAPGRPEIIYCEKCYQKEVE